MRTTRLSMAHRAHVQGGWVLALTAIAFPVLIGLAGLSIDLGNWYLQIQKLQRAVDSAALSGAVFLPSDPAKAALTARGSLIRNGVAAEMADAADIRPVAGKPAYLAVQAKTEVPSYFIQLLNGPKKQAFQRHAEATWRPPLGTGRYSNVLGNEPGADKWEAPGKRNNNTGGFWLSIIGPRSVKNGGDQYNSARCIPRDPNTPPRKNGVDGCSGITNLEQKLDSDGNPEGRSFTVEVPPGAAGNEVAIEVFDPAFVLVGGKCNSPDLHTLYNRTGNQRWHPLESEFCTDDTAVGGDKIETFPTTYYTVRDKKTGNTISSCPATREFRPYGSWAGESTPIHEFANDSNFKKTFRQWVRLCNVPYDSTKGISAELTVRTNAQSEGVNSFSLRAALLSGGKALPGSNQQPVRVYGNGHVVIYASRVGADARFPLTFVPPSFAGSSIDVSFFDIGNSSKPGSLSLVSEGTSSSASSPTRNCELKRQREGEPRDAPDCTIAQITPAEFLAQTVTMTWHVPQDYKCDPVSNTPGASCHLLVRTQYPPDSTVLDISTWTVQGGGTPPRLTPRP